MGSPVRELPLDVGVVRLAEGSDVLSHIPVIERQSNMRPRGEPVRDLGSGFPLEVQVDVTAVWARADSSENQREKLRPPLFPDAWWKRRAPVSPAARWSETRSRNSPPASMAPSWRWSPTRTSLASAASTARARAARSRVATMDASPQTITSPDPSPLRPRRSRFGEPAGEGVGGDTGLLGEHPGGDRGGPTPVTRCPAASHAWRAAARQRALPDPAGPTSSPTRSPGRHSRSTAAACSLPRPDPSRAGVTVAGGQTAATAMVRMGVDVKTAQARLGHSDPRLTLIYAQATTDGDRVAADLRAGLLTDTAKPVTRDGRGMEGA